MNFDKNDMIILVVMLIAVVSLGMTLPALGLTDADPDEDDLPEFNVTSDRFDFAGDFPTRPGGPGQHNHEAFGGGNSNLNTPEIEIDGGDGFINTYVIPSGNDFVVQGEVGHTPEQFSELIQLEQEGDRKRVTEESLEIDVEFELVWFDDDQDVDDIEAVTLVTVHEQPESTGWISNVPIVGTIVDGGSEVAASALWIGQVILWFFLFLFEMALNLLAMLAESTFFVIELFHFLLSTYADVIAGANTWSGIFVSIPMVIMMLVFVKLVFVAISLLPTT